MKHPVEDILLKYSVDKGWHTEDIIKGWNEAICYILNNKKIITSSVVLRELLYEKNI